MAGGIKLENALVRDESHVVRRATEEEAKTLGIVLLKEHLRDEEILDFVFQGRNEES